MKTPLDLAIDAASALDPDTSGIARIAMSCGVTRQFIQKMKRQWHECGSPPRALRDYAAQIEVACGSAVTAEELFPGVEWSRDSSGAVTHYCVPVSGLASNAQQCSSSIEAAA